MVLVNPRFLGMTLTGKRRLYQGVVFWAPSYPGALHAGEWLGKAEGEGLLLSSNGRVSSLAPQAMRLTGETTLSQLPGAVEDK